MLTPWKESYDQPRQHIKNQRHNLPTKVCLVKAMVFPVVMYGCESWTVKKAEHRRTDAFKLVLEKTLENPSDSKGIQSVHPQGNQSWMFFGRTNAEAETPILCPPDAKNWLIEKTLMLGRLKTRGEGDERGWDGWMASLTQWTWVWVNSGSWWWTRRPGELQSTGLQRVRHNWAIELNWTELLVKMWGIESLHKHWW